MQLFDGDESGRMVPILGVSLILAAFMINLLGNRMIQGVASFIGILKIGGILVFGLVGIWIADSVSVDFSSPGEAGTFGNLDRKSTRLNSSHDQISYAVFCLKKKKKMQNGHNRWR